jgi:hypothetical protein
MGLYLQIGAYSTPVCTVRCTGRTLRPVEYNAFIVAHEHEQTFEGYLYADGPGNISSAMALLETAVKAPNVDVSLISTSTGTTQHVLLNSGSIGGVVLKDFKFVDTPLHMATQIKFQMTAVALYGNVALARNVVSLTETIRIQGDGGPDVVLAQQAGAKSIYQEIAAFTDVVITQSGKVVSRSSFVAIPAPVITTPGAKISKNTSVTRSYRQRGTTIWLYEQDYSYTFQLPEMPGSPVVPSYLT